uniref:Amino acid permease/ SLC12A domain-containing protein n=1 Tax=Bionectria ochroleuca TaxID=29856 RepID=A0A8H7K380_BIOOC
MAFLNYFKGSKADPEVQTDVEISDTSSGPEVIHDGNLAYTRAKAGNGSKAAYQEAVGAPVETDSPLGYEVGWFTVIFVNINMLIGTGIFSLPANILLRTGSIGLSLIFWFIGFLMAASGISLYLEFASYFPNRSGSEVVYLEQAYPRPKYFFPIAFAVQEVILNFGSSNAIVFAEYAWKTGGTAATAWQKKGVAVAIYTIAILCVIANNKLAFRVSNVLGVLKLIVVVFIGITGLVVLGGNLDHIPNPTANFKNAFEGHVPNGYSLANALVSVQFAYGGYNNAFNMVNEIKNPIPTLKRNTTIALVIVSVLYQLCNIAYFAVVPKDEFASASQTAATLFFQRTFRNNGATIALNFCVMMSAFGNLMAVLIGQSRMIREIGRQGVLPYPEFWASTKPFGTPLGPCLISWLVTFIMIVAPPAGDAFQFVVDLQSYPSAMFQVAMTVGIYVLRWRRRRSGIPVPSSEPGIVHPRNAMVASSGGANGGDVSFWYATYCVVGIGIIIICGLYYVLWIFVLPKYGGYKIRSEMVALEDGAAKTHRLVKVKNEDVEEWDNVHDEAGHLRQRTTTHREDKAVEE